MDDARIQKLLTLKEELEEKVKQNPSARAFWVQLGNISRQIGDKERAISALRKALELKSDDTFTRNTLAELEGRSLILPTKKTPVSLAPAPPPSVPFSWLPPRRIMIPALIGGVLLLGGVIFLVVRGLFTADPLQLKPAGKNLMYPQISPDGKWVAYIARPPEDQARLGKSSVYVSSLDGKTTQSIITEDGSAYISGSPVWLPDSSAFIIRLADQQSKYSYHIYKADGSGRIPIPLEIAPDDRNPPVLNPDGTQIAYSAMSRKDYSSSLIVAYLDTGKGMEIANSYNISGISWSPDGNLIAFCAIYKAEKYTTGEGLYVMKPDGADMKMLPLGKSGCIPVFWGKKDTKLVYVSNQNLFYVSPDTLADPKPLIPAEYKDRVLGDLTVSPEKSVLAFSVVEGYVDSYGQRRPVSEIFLLEEGKTTPLLAKESHKDKFSPSLSPGGKWMAFCKFSIHPAAAMQLWVGSTVLN